MTIYCCKECHTEFVYCFFIFFFFRFLQFFFFFHLRFLCIYCFFLLLLIYLNMGETNRKKLPSRLFQHNQFNSDKPYRQWYRLQSPLKIAWMIIMYGIFFFFLSKNLFFSSKKSFLLVRVWCNYVICTRHLHLGITDIAVQNITKTSKWL